MEGERLVFFLALYLTFTCGIGVFLLGWENFSFGSRLLFEGERQPVAVGYQVSGVVKCFPGTLESPKTEGSTVPSCEIMMAVSRDETSSRRGAASGDLSDEVAGRIVSLLFSLVTTHLD